MNFAEEKSPQRRCLEKYIILDFEASSLSHRSWPIEVGASWLANEGPVNWSTLIKPSNAWNQADWSEESAAVHRIPFEQLDHAPDTPAVVERFLQIVGNRQLVSDAPRWEARWLQRLLTASGHDEHFVIADFDAVTFDVFEGLALDLVYEEIERRRVPHRAGPDTSRLMKGWIRGLSAVEGYHGSG